MRKHQTNKNTVHEDSDKFDVDKNMNRIIERILSEGSWIEFNAAVAYYGKDQIAKVVKNAKSLDELTHSFCSVYFNIPKEEFHCYSGN